MIDIARDLLISLASAAIAAVAGLIGTLVKRAYDKIVGERIAKSTVETCVSAVEQLYHDLDGAEKKQKAIEYIVEMLEKKGITIAQVEIELMIEAAVAEFNDAFNQPRTEQIEQTETE